jgi:hypothetical protein
MDAALTPLLWFALVVAVIPAALWLLKRTPLGGGAQGGVEFNAGQEGRVLVARVDGVRDIRLKGPDEDGLALAGQHLGYRGAPGAGADNADFLEVGCHRWVLAQAGVGGKRCFRRGA